METDLLRQPDGAWCHSLKSRIQLLYFPKHLMLLAECITCWLEAKTMEELNVSDQLDRFNLLGHLRKIIWV